MNIRSKNWLYRASILALTILFLFTLAFGTVTTVQAGTLIVDDDFDDTTPGWGVTSFATISSAVTVAAVNDTIEVKAGTYVEQVSINKNLTLTTTESAVIKGFDGMPLDCTSALLPNNPIVCVNNMATVTIDGFTIDGDSKGDTNPRMMGIAMRNAGGTLQNNVVQNIRPVTVNNSTIGVGIYVYNSDVMPRTINILNNTITNFLKNGITLTTQGAWDPITFNIAGNTITGIAGQLGPYNSTVVQNGIQVEVPRAPVDGITGNPLSTIQNNTFSTIAFNNNGKPSPWVAVDILNFSTPVNTLNNTINGAQVGIAYLDGTGLIQGNTITAIKPGTQANPGTNVYGMLIGDRLKDTVSPVDPPTLTSNGLNAQLTAVPRNVVVEDNTLTFTGAVTNPSTLGIEVNAGYGINTLTVDLHANTISGFDKGAAFFQCETSCDTGAFTSISFFANTILSNGTGVHVGGQIPDLVLQPFHHNRIVNNTLGLQNGSSVDLNANDNWWGCNAGPGAVGCGSILESGTGAVAAATWLELRTALDATTILFGQTSTLTADLRYNNNDGIPAVGVISDTTPVAFSVKTSGSVLPTSGFFLNGLAETLFTAPNTEGVFEVCATVDNQEICSAATVQAAFSIYMPVLFK